MFGSCQFLCLLIVWLSISFLRVSKELCIPSACVCHLMGWHSALCPSAQITITRLEFVSLAYCTGYSPFFLFLLIEDFLKKIRAFLSMFLFILYNFTYIHYVFWSPLHSCFPIVFIKNTFFLLLVLVLFIVPQSLSTPVCVILNLEQTIRADERAITVHLDCASPRVCLLTHRDQVVGPTFPPEPTVRRLTSVPVYTAALSWWLPWPCLA